MQSYKITKYNPLSYGAGGKYMNDEWTSISDIGKIFNDNVLTHLEYQAVEDAYLAAIRILATAVGVDTLRVIDLETHDDMTKWRLAEGQYVPLPRAMEICREMLREKPIWCRLENAEHFYVHIGYDYYMYIGVRAKIDVQSAIHSIKELGLFVEENWPSPYSREAQ